MRGGLSSIIQAQDSAARWIPGTSPRDDKRSAWRTCGCAPHPCLPSVSVANSNAFEPRSAPAPAFGGNPRTMPLFAPRDVTAEKRSDPIAAVIWVTIAMALFAGLAVFARVAMNSGLHPFVVVFLRNVFAVAMLLPLLAWRGSSLAPVAADRALWLPGRDLVPVDAGLVLRHLAHSDRRGDGDRLPGAAVRHAGRHLPARREGSHAPLGRAPDRFRRRHDHSAARRRPAGTRPDLRRAVGRADGRHRRSHQAAHVAGRSRTRSCS